MPGQRSSSCWRFAFVYPAMTSFLLRINGKRGALLPFFREGFCVYGARHSLPGTKIEGAARTAMLIHRPP